ncbi:MAG: T9SS type A sorting domain-containing protein [Bacteroidetes bacterium]|nr:T9SS type A sorting domain-containing protein [Bacteroidota bacterium]
MKNATIIISFFILSMLETQAQGYLISFAATGDTTIVDTIKVDNLNSGAAVILRGGDILHLKTALGIGYHGNGNGDLQLYPNPMKEQSIMTFLLPEKGNTVIRIIDLSGKIIHQISRLLAPGEHSFYVSGIGQGSYFVEISGNGFAYSTKFISQNSKQNEPEIGEFSAIKSIPDNMLKNVSETIEMTYNDGDLLVYKAISGKYTTLYPDVPASSKTVTFNFAACTDGDHNNYAIVSIGTQTWMAENLNVGVRVDGVQDQTNNATIEKYCHSNNVNNCAIYGGLYQWGEVVQYLNGASNATSWNPAPAGFVTGICPSGWHLPTDIEWTSLTNYLGGLNVSGAKMKTTGTFQSGTGLWHEPNTTATNESGFSALPSAYIYPASVFYLLGDNCFWWSSTEDGTSLARDRGIHYYYTDTFSGYTYKHDGLSVRCLRNF